MKLEEIYHPIEADLDRVHRILRLEMEQVAGGVREGGKSSPKKDGSKFDKFTSKAITYLLNQPGKSLRPALVLFSARSVGAEITDALVRTAAAIELIHSSSLVHDDIIDEADKRRNSLSVHKKYGVKSAILIGDVLFSQALTMASLLPGVDCAGKLRVVSILTELTRRMCYGEIFEQRILESGEEVDRASYLRILEFKTALLMSAACRCGAIIGGADSRREELLASYGLNFGYAYQLVDDYRDGDSIFSGDLDLMSLAAEYVDAAALDVKKLPITEPANSLSDFARFILASR